MWTHEDDYFVAANGIDVAIAQQASLEMSMYFS
jgi:hypothetical protein